jgi:signal transduction histidine kinase
VVSNSAVHGRATRMSAKVRSEGEDLTVEISNNAPDLAAMAGSGQGSLWLEGFTDSKGQPQATAEYRRTFRV